MGFWCFGQLPQKFFSSLWRKFKLRLDGERALVENLRQEVVFSDRQPRLRVLSLQYCVAGPLRHLLGR